MKVMKASGSLTASAGGTPAARRRRRPFAFGSTASSVARAIARSTFLARPFALAAARSSPLSRVIGSALVGRGLVRSLPALGLFDHIPAPLAPHRSARQENPPDAGNRLAADQPAIVEQPRMFAVKLLERVVGQHRGTGLFGDAQQEGVTPADGARRRRYQFPRGFRLLEHRDFRRVDAMPERGIHHDGHHVGRVLGQILAHRLIKLGEARQGPPFRGQVGAVDDDLARRHDAVSQAASEAAIEGNPTHEAPEISPPRGSGLGPGGGVTARRRRVAEPAAEGGCRQRAGWAGGEPATGVTDRHNTTYLD